MFLTRLASGIVLVIIALAALSFGGIPLALILWLISLVALRELTRALKAAADEKKTNLPELLGMAGVTAYYLCLYFSGDPGLLFLCVVGLFLLEMLAYVAVFPRYRWEQVSAVVFAFLYAPVMLSFLYLTRESGHGIFTVWLILISSWGCDTCAYVTGMLIGRKKIFPVLSPKKSLEGCIGGVLGAALLGWLYGHFFVEKAMEARAVSWQIAAICGAGAVMSMVGDLAASAIKRNNNIKDYGKLIPGHGGIMDRFDSVIVTAPMIYFLTVYLLPVS